MRTLSVFALLLSLAGCSYNKCDGQPPLGGAGPLGTNPWVAVEGVGCTFNGDCGNNGALINRCVSGICHKACSPNEQDRAPCDPGYVCTQGRLCEGRGATHPGGQCDTSYDCMGPSNLCLAHVRTGATICGSACSGGQGAECPAYMRCVDVGADRYQCATSAPEEPKDDQE